MATRKDGYLPSGSGGGDPFDPNRVKGEKTEAEKIYIMTETADTMKEAHGELFPLKPPQRVKKLKVMFGAPRGVLQNRRKKQFFVSLIQDIGIFDVKSSSSFGPSSALAKYYMKKDTYPPKMQQLHNVYAVQSYIFIRLNNVLLLALDKASFLKNSNDDGMNRCLIEARKRWYASNLIPFPTSPQVMAAQIVRNHARVYSEDPSGQADPAEYQKAVRRLIYQCTGLERALVPEGNMAIENHMRMSWYRIRRRVLERMLEEVNKLKPGTEKNFSGILPFGIKTFHELVGVINDQIGECDALWARERDGEILLSDGPATDSNYEEDVEVDESMRGEEMNDEEGEGSGIQRANMERAPSGQMNVQREQYAMHPPSHALPAAPCRMNQMYNYDQSQRKQQKHGGDTLRTVLANELPMGLSTPTPSRYRQVQPRGSVAAAAAAGGRGGPAPQMTTPTASGGERGLKMVIRRDKEEHAVDNSPSASPSTSTTLTRGGGGAVPLSQTAPSVAQSTPQQQSMQPPLSVALTVPPSVPLSVPPTVAPSQPVTPTVNPLLSGTPMRVSSPMFPSPQLVVMGPDGVMQSIPSVIYLERTDSGLVQIQPPTPQPQLMMMVDPTMGGRKRDRSHSTGRRRVSLARQLVKRRREEYEGDRSSEGSEEDEEEKRERMNARRERYARQKKEESEIREKEERDEKEREEKEEEEFRKKEKEEEERKKREMERLRKEEELKAAEEMERVTEKTRKEKEEEEEAAKKKTEESRVKERDEYEESGDKKGEETRVLAEDSSEESGGEERMESDDEVVAESVVNQSDKEEEEKERSPYVSTPSVRGEGEKESEDVRRVVKESGVTAPRPSIGVTRDDGSDSDIEYLYDTMREPKPKMAGNGEAVAELQKVKKELSENADNDVLCIEGKERNLPPTTIATSKNRETPKSCIKERADQVKVEDRNTVGIAHEGAPVVVRVDDVGGSKDHSHNETRVILPVERSEETNGGVDTSVKREEEEDEGTDRAMIGSDGKGVTDVKNEVKEEMEEEVDDDAMVTMIERRTGEDETDVMNRSGELDFLIAGEDEEIERSRIVLEAMTQEDSSQIAFTVAPSDTISTETALAPTESVSSRPSPLVDSTVQCGGNEEAVTPLPLVETPQVTRMEREMTVSTPRSSPIILPPSVTLSSHGERMPGPQTRLSARQIELIDRTNSLLMPYQASFERSGQRDAVEKEKERENEREKEKEGEVEVMREVPLTDNETDSHILTFHTMRGEAAVLSEDRRRAIRDDEVDSCVKAVVFTNRPIMKGERVTLRVIEIAPDWKGRIRIGLTTRNPLSYASRKAIPRYLIGQQEEGYMSYLFDSGVMNTVKMGSELEVQLSEKGDELHYWFDGVDMGAMATDLIPDSMYLSVDIYGFVKGVQIVNSVLPQGTAGDEISCQDQIGHAVNKESHDVRMKSVQKEEEVASQSCPSILLTLPLVPPVPSAVTPVEGQTEIGNGVDHEKEEGETHSTPTENIPEGSGEEKEKEEEEHVVETAKRAIEEKEMGEEPATKKRRLESSDVIVETEEEEEEEEKEEETTVETNTVNVTGCEDGVTATEEETRDGEETEKLMEDTVEKEGDYAVVIGGTNDEVEREEVASENVNEGEEKKDEEEKTEKTEERGESSDTRDCDVSLREGVTDESTEPAEEVKETVVVTPMESTEEERMDIEESPVLPIRRVSLFGPGCYQFHEARAFVLDAKEKSGKVNGDEGNEKEEKEDKMEVDDDEVDESPRPLMLFGPGCSNLTRLLREKMDKKNL